jgi:hypothetical protein
MENKQTAIEWLVEKIQQANPSFKFDALIRQAKQMEKQQMIGFAEFVATYHDKNKNVHGDMLHAKSKYDGAERTIDLLETFKSE